MIITFENGEKVIEHPSGVVVKQTISDIDKMTDFLIEEINILREDEANYQKDRAKMVSSVNH